MIRVAVIGSSHVGAIKEAEAAIRAGFPSVRLQFFAVPGGAYRRCVLRGGILQAKPDNDREAALIVRVNGALSMDLARCDQVLVTGNRFGYGKVLQAWINGEDPTAEMAAAIEQSVSGITQQFGRDARLTFLPAPYPALRARAPGPKHEARLAQIQRHPDRDTIFAEYERAVTAQMRQVGLRLLPQPAETRAAPFATKNHYLTGARDFRDGAALDGDLRHMNADYGLAAFTHYAQVRLGLTPQS